MDTHEGREEGCATLKIIPLNEDERGGKCGRRNGGEGTIENV